MLQSFEEYKFFQSFRIPIHAEDNIQFIVEYEDHLAKFCFIDDAKLLDISTTGIGFLSQEPLQNGQDLRISINFKRLKLELNGHVVRAFSYNNDETRVLYGVEVSEEDIPSMRRLIEHVVLSFSTDRSRECLKSLALSDRYKTATDGIEVLSLILSLFRDISGFGQAREFVRSILEESTRVLNAQRASILLINPEKNILEAFDALGVDPKLIQFDYRKGVAGSVFTTGRPLNIEVQDTEFHFSELIDEKTGFETKSIICYPIFNRDEKAIGVIEILNKRNEPRFNLEDEKVMKVMAMVFSSVFYDYNPIARESKVRRFSLPHDRELVLIGQSNFIKNKRESISSFKDLDVPIHIWGPKGTGKQLMARIIHEEGTRGSKTFEEFNFKDKSQDEIDVALESSKDEYGPFSKSQGGAVLLKNIDVLTLKDQEKIVNLIKNKYIQTKELSLDFQCYITTRESLETLLKTQKIHFELYRILNVLSLEMVSLAKRSEDIPSLIEYFTRKECKEQGLLLKEYSKDVMQDLKAYSWPGNVDELATFIKRLVLLNQKNHLIETLYIGNERLLPLEDATELEEGNLSAIDHPELPLKDRVALLERRLILSEIKKHKGNKSKAAREMGISREALRKKLMQSDEVLAKLVEENTLDAA